MSGIKKDRSSLPLIHSRNTYSQPNMNTQNIMSSHSLHQNHNQYTNNYHNNSNMYTQRNALGASSLTMLSSQDQLAIKSKSPSCKQFFGESFTKKKIPISSLSVTKYKQLLAQQDNDPKHPDISLHIPVDSLETQNFIKSLNQQNINEQAKGYGKQRLSKGMDKLYEMNPSTFIPFKNSKEINRNQFIKLHQENPSFQNLDFKELYQTEDQQYQLKNMKINSDNRLNDRKLGLNQFKEEDEFNTSDEEDDEENDNYGINLKKKGYHYGKQTQSAQSLGQRQANKIQLSLIHNKDIHNQLNQSLLMECMDSYNLFQNKIQAQEQIIKNMPNIRKYPIFKKKQLNHVNANENNNNNNNNNNGETKDGNNNNNNQEQNKDNQNKQGVGSNRFISDKNNQQIVSTQEIIDPLHNKFKKEDDEKKVRFYNQTDHYQVYWYSFEQNHWKPDIRECQTLIIDAKKGYLFGGVGKELYNQVVELDLESFKWQELKPNQMNGNIPSARFGHSCNLYKKNLIYFGGEYKSTQNQVKFKDCLLDVHSYNLETKTWKYITCTGGPLQPRRSHASAIIGRNLLISGGVNAKDQSLKDMWFLDLGTQTWSEAVTTGELEASFHRCVPVYHSQRCGKINIYKTTELKITKWGATIQQEGVYFFGGKNVKGEILGDLKILKTETKPMQWIKPDTKGIPPKARYGHTMDFSQEFNFVIIHGGKNDNEQDVYFNDLHLLNVDDFNWIKLKSYGNSPKARFNHSSCIYESKLIIFGGINLDGYLPPFVSVLELDNVIAGKMNEREESVFNQQNINNQMPKYSLSGEKEQKKGMKSSIHNIRLDHIPFSERIKDIESGLEEQKILINQLSFQNFKSYLPVPRFPTQPYSRVPGKRNTFLKQNINVDSNTNQMKTPTSSQKSITYE